MPDLKLTNMKLDPKKREAKYAESSVAVDAPLYPYGLRVSLDEDAIDAMALKTLPAVGTTLMLVARVDVTNVSSDEHAAGDGTKVHKHRSVSFQITDLALGPNEKSDEPAAQDVLYDSKG